MLELPRHSLALAQALATLVAAMPSEACARSLPVPVAPGPVVLYRRPPAPRTIRLHTTTL